MEKRLAIVIAVGKYADTHPHPQVCRSRRGGVPQGSAELIVPNSTVQHFGDEIAIAVERYDRVRSGGRWSRIHQEDMCQALGLHPTSNYESDGGPGVRTIAELLREQSSNPEEDVQPCVDAIAFNWLIAGTDAHAKNYALLLGGSGAVRLAPLYDLVSILPYQTINLQKAKLAMKIGGEYRLRNIRLRHWKRFATDLRLDEAWLMGRIRTMAASLPDHATSIRNELEAEGLSQIKMTRLAQRLKTRAPSFLRLLHFTRIYND